MTAALAAGAMWAALGAGDEAQQRPAPQAAASGWEQLPGPAQAAISRSIGRDQARYRATSTADGYRFTASGLTARLDRAGAVVRSGRAEAGLALRGVGYGDRLRALSPVTPRGDRNRVEYRHAGLSEWFVNGPAGLEHGFTLTTRPAGARRGPLTLSMALTGAATAKADADGRGLTLGSLRYGGLWASDARGRDIPARLETYGRDVRVRIDDRRARYPLTIDPILQAAELTASDPTENARLGFRSIAVDGDTIAVGSFPGLEGGGIYVFERPATGWATATEVAKLVPSPATPDTRTSVAVDVSGDTIIANAITGGGGTAVLVWERPPGGWVDAAETARLVGSDRVSGSPAFGAAIAIDGDTVAVGAPGTDTVAAQEKGAVYVYERPPGGWVDATEAVQLDLADASGHPQLGVSVAIAGATIAAGAAYANGERAGRVAIFERPPGGWTDATESHLLTRSGATAGDGFGRVIAFDGDTLLAARVPGATVEVFPRPPGGWVSGTETATLTRSDGDAITPFGLAVSGGRAVITWRTDVQVDGAYVYDRPAGGWVDATERERLTLPAGDGLGGPVDVSGDTIVVSAPLSTRTEPRQGVAFAFVVDDDAPATTITAGPSGATSDATPTFAFESEAGATFECAVDGGFAPCSSPFETQPLGDGPHTFRVRATDAHGNTESPAASRSFSVDTTPPAVSCGGADGAWHSANVSIGCTASDTGAGLADPGQTSLTLHTSVAAGAENANASTDSVQVCDAVGNCTTAGPIGANKIDRKAPQVTLTTPANGATYSAVLTLLSPVKAAYSCSDSGSGVASCSGTQPNGATVNTGLGALGPHTFTVTATDQAGNTSAVTNSYTVGLLPILI